MRLKPKEYGMAYKRVEGFRRLFLIKKFDADDRCGQSRSQAEPFMGIRGEMPLIQWVAQQASNCHHSHFLLILVFSFSDSPCLSGQKRKVSGCSTPCNLTDYIAGIQGVFQTYIFFLVRFFIVQEPCVGNGFKPVGLVAFMRRRTALS
jgi:hypothetical protein